MDLDAVPTAVASVPQGVSPRSVLTGALAAVALTGAFLRPWERRVYVPYRDPVGILTVCEGVTHGVLHQRYTDAQCDEVVRQQVRQHLAEMAVCIHVPLTQHQWVAIGSWAYNTGTARACRSQLVRKINAGASRNDWCRELLKWDYAGGRRLRGLTRRREAEYAECLR